MDENEVKLNFHPTISPMKSGPQTKVIAADGEGLTLRFALDIEAGKLNAD